MANLKDTTITGNLNVTGQAPGFVKAVKFASENGYSGIAVLGADGNIYCHSGNRGHSFLTCRNRNDTHYVPWGIFPYASATHYGHVVDACVQSSLAGFGYYLLDNGQLYTWGYRGAGLGTTALIYVPTLSLSGVSRVWKNSCGHAGANFGRLFAQKTDGTIWATGYNVQGQLGIGNTTNQEGWVQVTALGTNLVREIWNYGAGWGATFAQLNDGRIFACGHNPNSNLGNNSTANLLSFTDVTAAWGGSATINYLYAGMGYFDTAGNASSWTIMRKGSSIYTCGVNTQRQIGDNTATQRNTPYLVPCPSGSWTQAAGFGGGVGAVFALNNTGNLYTWGHNLYNKQFTSVTTDLAVPTLRKSGIANIMMNHGFDAHTYGYANATFAAATNGVYFSGGYDAQGQRGNNNYGSSGDSTTSQLCGLPPYNEDPVIEMCRVGGTDGTSAYFAITQSGKLFGWGNNGSYEMAVWNTSQYSGATQYAFYNQAV